ncbi:MAG TPA: hypothetical protein VFW45_15665 [Candidatus Polarisedimenticolia bacterium]|nr:hypothetical protein [Candidatus Polarisedimenticolia bacterium]
MPARPPRAALPSAPEARRLPLLREALRATAAFAIYLAFEALPESAGIETGYWRGIAAVVRPVLKWIAHFEGQPASATRPENQHSHLALIAALLLVSWSIPWRRRVRRFALLASMALAQDLTVAAISCAMHDAKSLYEMQGWVVLLPWEYNALQIVWYILYAIPLEFVPFLLVLIVALWNGGIDPSDWLRGAPRAGEDAPSVHPGNWKPRMSPRRKALAGGIAALLIVAGATFWIRLRDGNPLHQRTHRLLGRQFVEQGDYVRAERQYRTALREGSAETAVQIGLGEALQGRGLRDEAVTVLLSAAARDLNEAERARVAFLLESMGSADPYRPQGIVAVPPGSRP